MGKRAGYTHSSTSGLSPREQLERQEESHPPEKTRPDSPVPPSGQSVPVVVLLQLFFLLSLSFSQS